MNNGSEEKGVEELFKQIEECSEEALKKLIHKMIELIRYERK